MSAPCLSDIGPIPDGESFYNPIGATSQAADTFLETWEDNTPTANSHYNGGPQERIAQSSVFEIAAVVDSSQSPGVEEDGQIGLLRDMDNVIRSWATSAPAAGITIPHDTLILLSGICRNSIQLVNRLKTRNDHLHVRCTELQETLNRSFAWQQYTDSRMISIRKKHNRLRRDKWRLDHKHGDLILEHQKVLSSYKNMKAQKDNIKKELDELKREMASDTGIEESNRKRVREM